MQTPTPHDITRLLAQIRGGDTSALDRLLPLVYQELCAVVRKQRVGRGASEALNTTALVHGGSLPDVPLDARMGDIAELRYFVGLTITETVDVLNPSPATIKREWTAARARLHREMSRPL